MWYGTVPYGAARRVMIETSASTVRYSSVHVSLRKCQCILLTCKVHYGTVDVSMWCLNRVELLTTCFIYNISKELKYILFSDT